MDFIKEPMAIENRSMELIAPYLRDYDLDEEKTKVYSRMIHASGDVEYAKVIKIGPGAIEAMKKALLAGCNIFTDVEMVKTGINKKKLASFGGEVFCEIANPEIAKKAKEQKITRSMAAMRHFGKRLDNAIIAIGNAPTALFEVIAMIKEGKIKPAAIVGTPVGFVGAAESKKLLADTALVPYITVSGTKGGSPIAASCVNAIMYLLNNDRG